MSCLRDQLQVTWLPNPSGSIRVFLADSQPIPMGTCSESGCLKPMHVWSQGVEEGSILVLQKTGARGEVFWDHCTHFHMCELRCRSSIELSAEQNRSSRRLNT